MNATRTTYEPLYFLLPDVIQIYGMCPCLHADEEDDRRKWLEASSDRGEAYLRVKERTAAETNRDIAALESKCVDAQREYETLVDRELAKNGLSYDNLKGAVLLWSEKKRSGPWKKTVTEMGKVSAQCDLDLFAFFSCVYDVNFGQSKRKAGPEAHELANRIRTLKLQSSHLRSALKKELGEAERNLSFVLAHGCVQEGRYFRSWSSLAIEKKEDRIKSYCEWYAQANNLTDATKANMTAALLDGVRTKKIKLPTLSWNKKLGIVTFVNVRFDDETMTAFNCDAPPERPKRSTAALPVEEPSRAQFSECGRLTSLLLLEITSNSHPNKANAVNKVMQKTRSHVLTDVNVVKFLNKTYDSLIDQMDDHEI